MRRSQATRRRFQDLLAEAPLVLSGGFGTELRRRGVPTPLPLWAAAALGDDPDAVRRLHADYVRAGADVVTANTFRTDRGTLERAGLSAGARALTKRAVELAREGVAAARRSRGILVAGSIGPLADCYRPQDVPADEVLRVEHGLRVGDLVAAGVDFVLVETMNSRREALAALGATHAAGVPAAVSFVCDGRARLLSGEHLAGAVAAAEVFEPLAVLVNCCAPPNATLALERLRAATERPVGVYANGRGHPGGDQGWVFRGGTRDGTYLRFVRRWLTMGARLVGGCCGTTPRTVRRIARLVRDRT